MKQKFKNYLLFLKDASIIEILVIHCLVAMVLVFLFFLSCLSYGIFPLMVILAIIGKTIAKKIYKDEDAKKPVLLEEDI